MGNIQIYDSKILLTPSGKVANDPNCCCGNPGGDLCNGRCESLPPSMILTVTGSDTVLDDAWGLDQSPTNPCVYGTGYLGGDGDVILCGDNCWTGYCLWGLTASFGVYHDFGSGSVLYDLLCGITIEHLGGYGTFYLGVEELGTGCASVDEAMPGLPSGDPVLCGGTITMTATAGT
jgi:hypothetical protein